jgi:homoserine kinase
MRSTVTVRVPASASNLGAGFDCVGVAVTRWLEVTARIGAAARTNSPVALVRRGTLAALTTPPEDDHLYRGFRAVCRAASRDVPAALELSAESGIPVARGLGSSAAATVAGAAAAVALLELDLGKDALLALCAELEGHPDNAAAAIYGGATLALCAPDGNLTVMPLAVHSSLSLAFAIPDFTVETKRARAVLPSVVPYAQAVLGAGKSAALVHGLAHADARALAIGLDDVLHVPYRRSLVPGYDEVTSAARAAGAFGATLSGSGPTLVAIAPAGRAAPVAEAMARAWRARGVSVECFHLAQPAGGIELG